MAGCSQFSALIHCFDFDLLQIILSLVQFIPDVLFYLLLLSPSLLLNNLHFSSILSFLLFFFFSVEALCLKCLINVVVKVADLEITRLRFNARLLQCLQCVFEVAVWAGGYRLSLCQKVTGWFPLIASVPMLSLPPSETLPLPHISVETVV